ncbi:MAG: AlpA family phage regulatory protein [Caulobacteraceae bacterium]|nr:AlpA family phage regulatory protein [Caulobacteraceae bacterium]
MDTPIQPVSQHKLIALPTVMAQTGMCRSWLYAAIKEQRFPKPVKIGGASRWDSRAVDAWVIEIIAGGGQ